jgi:hypothetical protein
MIVTGYSGRVFEHVNVAGLKIKSRNEIDEETKANILKMITFKMMCGRRLNREEMDFLKNHSPENYEKAVRIEKDREEYRKALRSCKTKEEALHFHIVTTMQPSMDPEKKMALFDEFTDFAKSREYTDLPNEFELKDDEQSDDDESKRKVKLKKNKFTNYEIKKPETDKILFNAKSAENGKFSTYDRNLKLVAQRQSPAMASSNPLPFSSCTQNSL